MTVTPGELWVGIGTMWAAYVVLAWLIWRGNRLHQKKIREIRDMLRLMKKFGSDDD